MEGTRPVRIVSSEGRDDTAVRSIERALRDLGIPIADVDHEHAGISLLVVAETSVETRRLVRAIATRSDDVLVLAAAGVGARERLSLLADGAADVIAWRECAADVEQVVARIRRWTSIARLVQSPVVRNHLVGDSPSWRHLLRRVVEIAHFTHASVLLNGESGTGKELVARLVHTLDPRADKGELVVLDCTTIVPTLAGSEFFGHERGAFTGAAAAREGAFELAHRGTLFLDEVGDLPLPLQAQLLRVIQEHTYKRVGGNTWQRTEFRLVCATHRDLAACVARGEFRHDLYHRIATWTFRLPSLADRREDVLALARHFVTQIRGDAHVDMDDAVQAYLVERDYPGNVRELRHTIQRLVDRHPGVGPLTVGQIPEDERDALGQGEPVGPDAAFEAAVRSGLALGFGLKAMRKIAEDVAVRTALALENGSIARASRRLGVTERALQLRQAERRRETSDDGDAEPLSEARGTPPP